jgi:hypothetical protein
MPKFNEMQEKIIYLMLLISRSRDSVVGITTGYRLDDREDGVQVPVGSRMFSSPCRSDQP